MKEIKKLLKLSGISYYQMHLSIINCLLPVKFTPKEIECLSCFMSLSGDISRYRFGPSAKKIVMANMKITPAGLSNYMNSLLDKGFLIQVGDEINILPILIPENGEQTYLFKLQKN